MSASRPSRASATSGSAGVLERVDGGDVEVDEDARRRTSERDAVVKSLQRVPTPRTTSASRAAALAAVVPVAPIAPERLRMVVRAASPCRPGSRRPGCPWPRRTRQRVGGLGVDRAAAARRSAASRAAEQRGGLGSSTSGSGTGRRTRHTRCSNSSSGKSNASACTSCGSASVTAPVSAGSVSTRIAASSAGTQLLGPLDPVPELARPAAACR